MVGVSTSLVHSSRDTQEAAAARLRGKRGKAKKAQAKYAHQDEDDRALALEVLDPAGRSPTSAFEIAL